MTKKHKISIPEPCHEDWNKMTPKDNGRFCLSCTKTVVDFTKMLPEEIQQYFVSNKNQNICGRFRKSQLDNVIIQIPSRVLYSQTNYYKMFLLALFVAMGTTLFSCQDKEGKKQKIDKVEVVKDTVIEKGIMVGEPAIDPNSAENDLPLPPNVDNVKFVKPTSSKNENTKSTKAIDKKTVEEPIYNGGVAIETNAEFPGGIEQFYNYFGKEFKKPDDVTTKNLKINLAFAIEKNGSVSYMQCIPAIDNAIEQEIIRVLGASPKWQPGEINGKKVRRQYSLPIVLQ